MTAALQEYLALGLPMPPVEAPLVKIHTGTTHPRDEPPTELYTLGFLLGPDEEDTVRVLVGTEVHSFHEAAPLPVAAEISSADGVRRWSLSASAYETNNTLATALQCEARGWSDLSGVLLAISGYGPDQELDPAAHASLFYEREGISIEEALWVLARAHLMNQIADERSDLADIHRRLVRLTAPDRYTPEEGPDAAPLLRSLEASLEPSRHPPGSIGREIDDLVGATSAQDARYTRLRDRGFEGIPALIEHLDDERLTRTLIPRLNNFPPYYYRINQVVSELILEISGEDLGSNWLSRRQGYPLERAAVEAWWVEAQREGEERYLVARVLPRSGEWPGAGMLDLILKRYPGRLPEIYQRALSMPTLQSYPIAKAITASALPDETKRALFLEGAKNQSLEHRRAALWELRSLDEDTFTSILVSALDALAVTPQGAYWSSREAAYANLVMETSDPRAWDALLRTARRVDVGLRMELMNPMSYAYIGERQRSQRIAFLAAMLDDRSVRDLGSDPERFSGPSAAFTLPSISVRDFAAMQLASILGLPLDPRPDEDWTWQQWEDLRATVAAALATQSE